MGIVTATIAVVDDDAGIRTALRQLLRAAAYDALTYASAEEFLDPNRREDVDCLIADIHLPGMSGVALVQTLAAQSSPLPVVLMTAHEDPATLALIRSAAPAPHLRKPFSDDELFEAIRGVLPR